MNTNNNYEYHSQQFRGEMDWMTDSTG